ncbi:MAG: CDP-diacylglycerol--glycerol-3-phosphate 3-phosphatidyltransferase [Geminicoccaceae bacterium]|nr:CDP-diacylglycerol--glycerol-3-phosphate 3-phosphatidyltransferase [Geminicoccaceae bacterium]MCS7268774.1 CDP-diacylglycerol--glycerol-3-phosphate 3-phosphatidyltransferase [Geminicoccaceae bacterium]MDW8125678.1 CDP-diacylglycerol--glycerol-3-phosphate 3-phosphatidyltransferase [Geminicoccaceae bacterium]MDW8340526.1 CDP-diacylglycerol--glycerol-3-phosphate 3-phosphatidyltransferase [Geminicoccaceae bacterium]
MLTSPPNLLTFVRIGLIPILVALFYLEGAWARWFACAVFAIAATTDYLDGWLARNRKQQSRLGRWLDPVADKLLVAATVLALVAFDRAPLLPSLVILLREILISGLREYLAEARLDLPVSRLAKWKTAIQMMALGFLIVGDAGPAWLYVEEVGFWGLWLAAFLTIASGWDYVHKSVGHMLDEPVREPRLRPARGASPWS